MYAKGAKTSVTVEAAWNKNELGMTYTIYDKGREEAVYRTTRGVEDFLTGYLDQELRHGR